MYLKILEQTVQLRKVILHKKARGGYTIQFFDARFHIRDLIIHRFNNSPTSYVHSKQRSCRTRLSIPFKLHILIPQ